jgi:hypothetical protein
MPKCLFIISANWRNFVQFGHADVCRKEMILSGENNVGFTFLATRNSIRATFPFKDQRDETIEI